MNRRRALLTILANSGSGGLALPYSDSFTASDGALPSPWTGATWTIGSNAALNTPTLGAEILTNPGFEGTYAGSGTLFLAPNWNNSGCDAGVDTLSEENTIIHGGTDSQHVITDAGNEGVLSANVAVTAGNWYQLFAWAYPASGAVTFFNTNSRVTFLRNSSGTGAWQQLLATARAASTGNENMKIAAKDAAAEFYADDASAKLLTLASLFATLPASVASVTAQAIVTVNPAGGQAGHVMNLDSITSPLNFVIAYLDGAQTAVTAKLDKCVNGTYTNVISGSVTYGATKYIKVVKSGDNYSLYYGTTDVQVGTTQAITGMNGTIHGLFATTSTPKFDTYQLAAT